MTRKILAFGASTSSQSINRKLANYAANQIENAQIEFLDLNDFEMPIYSIDREQNSGIPDLAKEFRGHIEQADGILISFAEHNGSYAAAFKNILDWVSRIGKGVWMDKQMFLLATSPGGRGATRVLEIAKNSYPFMGGKVAAVFSLPFFGKNFSEEAGITDEELNALFQEQLQLFEAAL